MREIEYRLWDKTDGVFEDFRDELLLNMHGKVVSISWFVLKGDESLDDFSDLYIIEQYIGIKDSRGKKIFKGDIILVVEDLNRSVHEVVWGGVDYPAFELSPPLHDDINSFSEMAFSGNYRSRVIGNIHENAELLIRKSNLQIW